MTGDGRGAEKRRGCVLANRGSDGVLLTSSVDQGEKAGKRWCRGESCKMVPTEILYSTVAARRKREKAVASAGAHALTALGRAGHM